VGCGVRMTCSRPWALAVVLLLAACSKPAANGGAAASGAAATPGATAVAAAAPVGNACDRKLITAADVAPLLSEPVSAEKTLDGDAQTCKFDTAGFSSVKVSLRPGLGPTTLDMIKSGKTNQTVTDLPGVGERAVWDPLLKEVDAEKGGLLCEINAIGPATSGATAEKVGALCSKIFAAG
jgi:hypothetical protein